MQLTLERWGLDFRLGGCIVRLVSGDTFIRLPWIGQVAWNQTGFYADRLKRRDTLDLI